MKHAWQQKVQVQKPSVDRGDKNFHLQQPNICRGNRTTTSRNQTFIVATEGSTYSNHNVQCGNRVATYSNQIFVVAIECFAYSNQNDQCGNRVAMCCNHKDSVAIEDPSIAMLLMRGNRFYCNNHCRCQCTYCHPLRMWQYVSLATMSVLQQLVLQHPQWLLMLCLATLHGVATKHHCVAIGKNLLQPQNKLCANLLLRHQWQRLPTKFLCCNFIYCNHFWHIATLLGRCIRGEILQYGCPQLSS